MRILPDDEEGELLDVKVFTKHGPDDAIYDNNKLIRDKVVMLKICYWLYSVQPSCFLIHRMMKF